MRATSILLTAMLLVGSNANAVTAKLPKLAADPAKVSVSGLSSGAFMAVQYATAFSASTIGVGVVAGGPYNCAFVNFGGIVTCMQGAPVGAMSMAAARSFAFIGAIDAADNLGRQKVYLFSGTRDTVVAQSVMNATRDFYAAAGVPAANLSYVNTFAAGHAFVSNDMGGVCGVNASPYIVECGSAAALYDQPQAILTQIYGTLSPKAATLSATPVAFDQRPFGASASGMGTTGFVYVPKACASGGGCAVHVVFHGCVQSVESVGNAVYARLGYNEWADANRIVVLYPQVNKSSLLPMNPQGCWDWWGYSGLDFQTQNGSQLKAVRAMVARLTAK